MSEELYNEASNVATEVAEVEPLSISDKFIGILSGPTEVFDNVRAAGSRTSDWLVPVAIVAVILALATAGRFMMPEIAAKMAAQQEEMFQKQVDKGAMTQDQADQAITQMESFKGLTMVFGTLGAAIGYIIVFFLLCLFYWLLVRFAMGGDVTFGLIMSAVGLTSFISAIDQIITFLLVVLTGNPMANLSLALLHGGGFEDMSYRLMMIAAPIAIWAQFVLGVGFARVANISLVKGVIASFVIWLAFSAITLFLGAAFGG